MSLPSDWQAQALKAKGEIVSKDPTKEVFGLSLPTEWKHELIPFVRSGELRKLLKVKAIAFEGKKITAFEAPKQEGDHGGE